MNDETKRNVTKLLQQCDGSDTPQMEQLFQSVLTELQGLAGAQFRNQEQNHTLQPTALVNEVYLRLVEKDAVDWKGRSHFKAVAAKAMRQVMIDHHRARRAAKRGGGWKRHSVSGAKAKDRTVDLVALQDALSRLHAHAPRQAKVVEMRFLGGLEEREIAHVLGVSRTTVQTEWRQARAWLQDQLNSGPDDDAP